MKEVNTTKYEVYKKCLNCGGMSRGNAICCSNCRLLFTTEADEADIKRKELIYARGKE